MTFVFISSEIVSFQVLLQWSEEVQGQCYKIEGQDIPRETAPGLLLRHGLCRVIIMEKDHFLYEETGAFSFVDLVQVHSVVQ
jgi:hypothetical protein